MKKTEIDNKIKKIFPHFNTGKEKNLTMSSPTQRHQSTGRPRPTSRGSRASAHAPGCELVWW